MYRYRAIRLLVLAAPWLLLASCRPAPTARTTQSSTPPRAALSTTAPAPRSTTHAERADSDFTHYVIEDTALLRRGVSDSDVIYDSLAAGTKVRMLRADEPYVRVVTEDGRDGLVIPGRLHEIAGPIIRSKTLRPAPALAWFNPPIPLIRPQSIPLMRTRSSHQVEAAIDKACTYLAGQQLPNGGWDIPKHDGQAQTRWQTALVAGTLAIAQGEDFKMRDRARAVLVSENESETFTLAFRDEVVDKRHNTVAKYQGALTLLRAAMTRDTNIHHNLADTFFGNWIDSEKTDPINTYFAFSAILNAERNGMEVPPNFWKDSDTQWRDKQTPGGGWLAGEISPSATPDFYATAAGFLILSETTDHLFYTTRPHFDHHMGNYLDHDIEAAAAWLDKHTTDVWTEILCGKLQQPCQTLWWLDQVMTQAGAIRLNHNDDITQMLQWLLDTQKADGSWSGDLSETAYAVRVLNSHLRPAGIGKLAYGSWGRDGNWNQRPSDIRHVSRWLGRHMLLDSSPMRSLIVDIDSLQEDLNALPILFIAGDAELDFNRVRKEKLRRFIEQGGLIVGNADLASLEFDKSFESLGDELFPGYQFRELPADHPIFTDQYPAKKWKAAIELRGLSNGVRELMLLIPKADLSLAWQDDQSSTHPEAFQLLGNILSYVNGRDLAYPSRELPAPLPQPHKLDRELTIARLQIGKNWNPEPTAWTRMADVMAQRSSVRLNINDSQLQWASLDGCKLAHLTGTTGFTLTPRQRLHLHDFVVGGGTLLIDAAGGSTEFANAAQTELQATFGDDAKQLAKPMPPEILFARPGGLAPLDGNPRLYRRAVQRPPSDKGRTPHLRVMKLGNRMAVFFSREDLTSALAGIESDSIDGYRAEIGIDLVSNILLYAEAHGG